jgi:hypothetical protein
MTFIPTVLPRYDPNNSGTGSASSYVGTSTATAGHLSININIDASNNSTTNGIVVSTSIDNITFTSYFTDTYFANTHYQKTVNLSGKYYRLSVTFTSSTTYTIATYLNTDFNQDGDNGVYLPAKVEAHYDAFGKLRVSNPYTLIDLKYPPLNNSLTPDPTPDYLKNNLQMICEPSNNTATATLLYQNSQAVFTQNGAGTITSQSRKYAIYQPGKSLICLASFVLNTSTSTSTSTDYALKVGYFDDYNGVFLQYNANDATPISFVVRSNTIGASSVINGTTYNQSVWNIDKLNGTGNSGILLDFTKAQLLVIDLEWLSVGRIRCGFMCFGKIVYCHQITNVNSLTGPYMYTANLPVRYQVVNNTTGTAILTKICATVISEGGYRPSGNIFSQNTGKLTVPNTNEYSVLFLTGNKNTTLNSNYYHNEVVLRSLSIYCATSADVLQYRIRLYLPGDSPGGPASSSYAAVASTSVIQYASSASTVTTAGSSIILDEGYVTATAIVNVLENVSDYILNNNSITSSIDNSQIGYIVVTLQSLSLTGNFDVYVSLNWAEF